MKRATPLCLLFLVLALVVQAAPSDTASDPPAESPTTADDSRPDKELPLELQVTFHERKPFLEKVELVEPEKEDEHDWGRDFLNLEFFRVGRVTAGPFEGSEIVLLTVLHWDDGPCKGDGCGGRRGHLRYLKDGPRMILLEAISDRFYSRQGPGYERRFLNEDPFARFGLVEEQSDTLTIPGFGYPEEISGPEPRQVLHLVDEQGGRLNPSKLVKVFTHPRLGEVYTTRPALSPSNRIYSYDPTGGSRSGRPGYSEHEPRPDTCYGNDCFSTNAFFVFRPDGTFLRYTYRPDLDTGGFRWLTRSDPAARPVAGAGDEKVMFSGLERSLTVDEYTYLSHIGCSARLVDDIAVVDPDSLGLHNLEEVAVAPGGDPLLAPPPEHPLHNELFDFYRYTDRYDGQGTQLQERIALPEFVQSRPILFWRDPFGRTIRLTRVAFLQPWFCEPIVYLYPAAPQRVIVSLRGGIRPSASAPEYDSGWTIAAKPTGELRDARDGKSYPYLFWEAPSPFVESPEKGSVVPAAEVEEFLRGALTRLGLNETERGDFIEAWLPEFGGAPYYFIAFFDRKLIDRLAPLDVDPVPDTVIRVLMDHRPLDGPVDVAPQELGPTPRREGFTLVEWGGLRR